MKLTYVLTPALVLALCLWVAPVQADGDDAAATTAPTTKQKARNGKGGKGKNATAAQAGDAAPATDGGAATTTGGGKGAGKGGGKGAGKGNRRGQSSTTTATPAPVVGDAQARVDQRQQRQAQRIESGVKRGSLTADEVTKLQAQQKTIADMEAQFRGDGKLTRDEAGQLRQSLNDASLQIWTEKRDTDGKQQSVVRLGKDVLLNDATAAKLEDPNLSRQDARTFTHDFARTLELKRKLASDDLPDDQRAALQKEYNDLLTKYFTVKTPAAH